eukprot:CAMPEP_0168409346 /NCGR_PEP_ID=MMETSP0228-20121227/27134_1 /TAXON_ID=133427 /ORGANISM="Protoceratium reticulatum, Strain CCCM 535 (=CCMP 1889)" /LENGTH=97 /DNA_ID=CAMNT_0008423051 /DNA_START=11 /DNA_END=304 /DNA_ORIENTATION=-
MTHQARDHDHLLRPKRVSLHSPRVQARATALWLLALRIPAPGVAAIALSCLDELLDPRVVEAPWPEARASEWRGHVVLLVYGLLVAAPVKVLAAHLV